MHTVAPSSTCPSRTRTSPVHAPAMPTLRRSHDPPVQRGLLRLCPQEARNGTCGRRNRRSGTRTHPEHHRATGGQMSNRERVTFEVTVDLDPMPGMFHTEGSAAAALQEILLDCIEHYHPVVARATTLRLRSEALNRVAEE